MLFDVIFIVSLGIFAYLGFDWVSKQFVRISQQVQTLEKHARKLEGILRICSLPSQTEPQMVVEFLIKNGFFEMLTPIRIECKTLEIRDSTLVRYLAKNLVVRDVKFESDDTQLILLFGGMYLAIDFCKSVK